MKLIWKLNETKDMIKRLTVNTVIEYKGSGYNYKCKEKANTKSPRYRVIRKKWVNWDVRKRKSENQTAKKGNEYHIWYD